MSYLCVCNLKILGVRRKGGLCVRDNIARNVEHCRAEKGELQIKHWVFPSKCPVNLTELWYGGIRTNKYFLHKFPKYKFCFRWMARVMRSPPPLSEEITHLLMSWSERTPCLTLYPSMHCTENPIDVFPEMKLRGLVPNSYIHVFLSDL
jgi:hypothetical protein